MKVSVRTTVYFTADEIRKMLIDAAKVRLIHQQIIIGMEEANAYFDIENTQAAICMKGAEVILTDRHQEEEEYNEQPTASLLGTGADPGADPTKEETDGMP